MRKFGIPPTTRCNAKPDCSPLGYPPRLLLINWSVNWFVCVQCSTCTRTQPCGLNTPRKSSVYWCGQQNPSTVDLLCYTYDGRVRHRWMHKVYYTLVTVTKKMCWLNRKSGYHGNVRRAIATQFHSNHLRPQGYQSWKLGEDRACTFWGNWTRWSGNKKISYRRGTAWRAVAVKTVLNVAQMFVELHLISPALGEWPSRSSKVIGNDTNR